MKCIRKILTLGILFTFTWFGIADAHKVSIFAWVEEDTVHTQSKFSGGKKVKNGKVEVFDTKGELLLKGHTDENGEFSFKVPKITELKIVLDAGMGHKNSWTLTVGEVHEGVSATDASKPVPSDLAENRLLSYHSGDDITNPSSPPDDVTTVLSAKDVEAIVARQLEQKLKPLTRMLADAQESGPTAGDIFGGIGYILGLVGLGVYIRYRKDDRRR